MNVVHSEQTERMKEGRQKQTNTKRKRKKTKKRRGEGNKKGKTSSNGKRAEMTIKEENRQNFSIPSSPPCLRSHLLASLPLFGKLIPCAIFPKMKRPVRMLELDPIVAVNIKERGAPNDGRRRKRRREEERKKTRTKMERRNGK